MEKSRILKALKINNMENETKTEEVIDASATPEENPTEEDTTATP